MPDLYSMLLIEKKQLVSYHMQGINEFDCIESLIIAYESKINIFREMRYFLMFYLNLGSMVRMVFVYQCLHIINLFILSNFSFLSIFNLICYQKVHMQSTSLIPPSMINDSEIYFIVGMFPHK